MKIVILCGGLGTRLREETEYRPKALVEIGGRPMLWHIMKTYCHHGFRDFVLCLGYRGYMIKEYFANYRILNEDFTITLGSAPNISFLDGDSGENMNVTMVNTGLDTMTGARVKRVEHLIDDDTFMLTYADGLSDLNFAELLRFHRSHGRLATVTAARPTSRFGSLRIGKDGRVEKFIEKPQEGGWVSAGYFVLNRPALDYISSDDPNCVLEREPLEKLARDGQLVAYQHDGFFFAMDTYREYLELNRLWESGRAPWKLW